MADRKKWKDIVRQAKAYSGRPRKRWKEEVERDLQVLVVRSRRELVADRKKWEDVVRQTKAHSGRPRKRWKEEVERDLRVLGVGRWRELVMDKKNGRILFDRPKPTVGCSANGRRKVVFALQ